VPLALAGIALLGALGLFLLHLNAQRDLPQPIPPDTPFFEFREEVSVAPLPEVFAFEHEGRQLKTLRLQPNQSGSWALPDLPQLVTYDGRLPPARRVMWYEASVNARDFRDSRVYDYKRPPGVFRVGVIGTGVTFGEGVSDEHTYCHVLQDLLNAQPPLDKKFEVINFGIPCMLTNYAENAFIKHSRDYEVDFWVFSLGVNDALPMFHRPLDDYRQHVRQLVETVRAAEAQALVIVEPANSFYPWMRRFLRYRAALVEEVSPHFPMVDIAGILDCHERSDGLRLELKGDVQQVVQCRGGRRRLLFEQAYQPGPDEQYVAPEVYEYLDTHLVWMRTFVTDVHMNEFGNRVVAESLHRYLWARLRQEPEPEFEACPLVDGAG